MVKEIDTFLIDTAGPKLCHRVTCVKSQTTSTACFYYYYNYCYDYYHYYCFLVVFLKIHETTFEVAHSVICTILSASQYSCYSLEHSDEENTKLHTE